MAPGLNGRQTGTVPKYKPRSRAQSQRCVRTSPMQSTSLDAEPVLDQNSRTRSHRKISSTHSEAEADAIRYDLANSFSSNMTSQIRVDDAVTEGGSQDAAGPRPRINLPDKKRVIQKITQIQDYIQQTASLMNALMSSDSPDKKEQCERLSVVIADLKDSEAKLLRMLKTVESVESRAELLATGVDEDDVDQGDNNNSNNNSDNNEEELIRRSEESKKKLELLQKRKQELLELQDRARKQLQEAQMEQNRLFAQASSLSQDVKSNRLLDVNMQQLNQRLKTAQQLYKTSNQINEALGENRELSAEEAEHPDEDQVEMSDTETDHQLVSDKVAELNMMKAQLAQLQKVMANISMDSSAKDGSSTPTELMTEDRRDQMYQQSRSSRNESTVDENNVMKLEQAKQKLNQLTQLLEIAQSVQSGNKAVPAGFYQSAYNTLSDEGAASARRTPSPTFSGRSQQQQQLSSRHGDEVYVETMQVMARELEERTAQMQKIMTNMKEEHARQIAARQEAESLARKMPIGKGERASLSPDDSGSEAPCLTNITMDSSGRILNTPSDQQSPYNERNSYGSRGQSKTRQRGVWNAFVPTINPGMQDKNCKNEDTSGRGVHHLGGSQNGLPREQPRWSPSPTVSLYENGSMAAVQNHIDKSNNMYGKTTNDQHTHRPVGADEITVEELYAQHQMLTRTVAQCSHLLWLQQKQIIELRNAVMLQQYQNVLPQPPSFAVGQPQRNPPPSPFQYNPIPPFPAHTIPPQTVHQQQQQDQSYLSPNVKMNSISDFTDHWGYVPPPPVPEGLDFAPRYDPRVNYPRTHHHHQHHHANLNANANQSSANNPVGPGVSCLGSEDSGALNNQVPPGNRANNYWDNFRSYSRLNLLSHSKSNEDTDRRTSTASNQERPLRDTASSIMIQNNAPSAPSHDVLLPAPPDPSEVDASPSPPTQVNQPPRPGHAPVSRTRSVEAQTHRPAVKNEDGRNINPKNEGAVRARNPDEVIRSVRNDVGQTSRNSDNVNSSRNFVQLVRELENDEGRGGINKKRRDKAVRTRNEGRGNLNNAGNEAVPVVLLDSVYSEVTNFIRANERRPHFLIQLFRDLQQVTTDPLRQRMLESIQETVNANNLSERSNLNIIDNRNNIRENRSNLNRNQGQDEQQQSVDNIVCQIRESQNTIRQSSGGGAGALNLENPNISNLRNLGGSSPRNNLESEGLRDLRTFFEANLCNFGHNSALENPNLSNIRENLTRRGGTGTDLENGNPKNLYLSMYDNAWRRSQSESQSENCGRNVASDQVECGSLRGNNAQCTCSYQSPSSSPDGQRGDVNFGENRQVPPRCSAVPERDNKYVNLSREMSNDGDGDQYNNDARKRGYADGSSDSTLKKNADEAEDAAGAPSLVLVDWDRYTESNQHTEAAVDAVSAATAVAQDQATSKCMYTELQRSDNGDLAEADQSRNDERRVAVGNAFANRNTSEADSSDVVEDAEAENAFANRTASEAEWSFDEHHSSDVIEEEENDSENLAALDNFASERETDSDDHFSAGIHDVRGLH